MRAILTAALFLLLTVTLTAQDAKPLLDKAITAAGGEANLKKYPALVLKGKGKYFQMGNEAAFTAEQYSQGADQTRSVTELLGEKVKIVSIRVVNKDKGWSKDNDQAAVALDKNELAEDLESAYFNYITTLAPLRSKEFKLIPLAGENVDGKPALGLLISHKGHRDVKLWFDKESSLLVKSERRIKDADSGKESQEEILFGGYKDVSGIKVASKFTVKSNGKTAMEVEMTEIKPAEKLDPKLFDRP
jgi:hypothetical protein